MELYAPYRIPFCQNFKIDRNASRFNNNIDLENSGGSGIATTAIGVLETTQQALTETIVWEILPENCRTSTIIVGAVSGVLLLLGLVFNILLIAAASATRPKPLVKKSDNAAVKRRKAFKSSLYVSSV